MKDPAIALIMSLSVLIVAAAGTFAALRPRVTILNPSHVMLTRGMEVRICARDTGTRLWVCHRVVEP